MCACPGHLHRFLNKVEERCSHALLECAAGTSDDGTFHAQKLELCIVATADPTCSAIYEQRDLYHGKDRRRGRGHPALRRAGNLATSAVLWASPTADPNPDSPLVGTGPKFDAVGAFGTGPPLLALALAGGNATFFWIIIITVVVIFRLARRRWCMGNSEPGHHHAEGVSPVGLAAPRTAVARTGGRTENKDTRAPGAAVPFAAAVAGGEVGTGSDRSRVVGSG